MPDLQFTLIHADGLVTGDGPTVRDAAVLVSGKGEVLDVGDAGTLLPRHAGASVVRVHGVVFPGLVNAHTHLELSAMRGRVPGGRGFVAWVDAFVGLRTEVEPDDERWGVDRAVADLDAFATAAVGDVSNRLAAVHPLARAGIGGSVFHEVFGAREEMLRSAVADLPRARAEAVGDWPTGDLAYAVAPHTLYTTHPAVVRDLARAARAASDAGHGPTSLHLAEHAAERSALETASGPMVDWLHARTRGASDGFPWPRTGPVAFADSLGALGPHVLAVHVTDVTAEEAATLVARHAAVVLCPRSNLFIELRLPPLVALRAAGVEAALGTDSLASNASLDVLAEARALQDRFPQVTARELLQMATWHGARALGRPEMGRIARGSRPGLAAVDGELGGVDPAAFLLSRVKEPRRWVVRRAPRSPRPEAPS
jgi:cytosine/adenosine deaminase-related metal-dependent hydrolase